MCATGTDEVECSLKGLGENQPTMNVHPDVIDEIIRKDKEFTNTGRPRLGGSTLSSGVFLETETGRLWLGKCDPVRDWGPEETPDGRLVFRGIHAEKTEAAACREKIASDIYAYYGAPVARIQISMQRLTNLIYGPIPLAEDYQGVHVMSEIVDGFTPYSRVEDFNPTKPICSDGTITFRGQKLPERGLGRILAVAALINDIDVIGGSGGNVGFQVLTDEPPGGHKCAQTIKIDPGEAFTDSSLADPTPEEQARGFLAANKHVRIATGGEYAERFLQFSNLPPSAQQEFILTLQEIVDTNEATIRGFFNRRGGHNFILHGGHTVDELTTMLIERRDSLRTIYAEDLQSMWSASKPNPLDSMILARKREAAAELEQLFFYIPPVSTSTVTPLPDIVNTFLNPVDPHRVLLITGDAGSGKSISLLYEEQQRLTAKQRNPHLPMVIFIPLKRFSRPTIGKCVALTLQEKYFIDPTQLKMHQVILLLDGYDEIGDAVQENIYRANELDTWPQLKVIITCRTSYCTPGYESWFTPQDATSLQIVRLAPFTAQQIDAYLSKYCTQPRPFTLAQYQQYIQELPSLSELITNPFVLRLLVEAMGELVVFYKTGSSIDKTAIYDCFMRYWFAKQERRLLQGTTTPANWDPIAAFEDFSQRLAIFMHMSQCSEVDYTQQPDVAWVRYLSNDDLETLQARSGCPLQTIGVNRYSFLHKSFLEYFAARYMISILDNPTKLLAPILAPPKTELKPKHVISEPAIGKFLSEMFHKKPSCINRCFSLIKSSRKNPSEGPIAAYAITLLNSLGINLSGQDFTYTYLPKARLPHMIAHGTKFTSADLSKIHMPQSYLAEADFQQANMQGMRFGELSRLSFDDFEFKTVRCLCSNWDGTRLAVGCDTKIVVFNSLTRLRLAICEGHSNWISCLAYSPDGGLASGDQDGNVFLWDSSGTLLETLRHRHKGAVISLSYSAKGNLASGGKDKIDAGSFFPYCSDTSSIAFGPNEQLVTTNRFDRCVTLWRKTKNHAYHEYQSITPSESRTRTVAFSLDGRIASGSEDGVITLSTTEGHILQSLKRHTKAVTCLTFSHNGLLASGGDDDLVILWDSDGQILQVLSGHNKQIVGVAFLSHDRLASGSYNGSVILWNLSKDGTQENLSIVHDKKVQCVTFAPNGTLASGDKSGKIIFWEVSRGRSLSTLESLFQITCIAFSPDGRMAACCSGDDIMLWDSNGQPTQTIKGVEWGKKVVAFNKDGLLAAGKANDIVLRNINSEEVQILHGHDSRVVSVVFSVDGRLASSDYKGITILWDQHGNKVKTLVGESPTFCTNGHLATLKNDWVFLYDNKGKSILQIDTSEIRHARELSHETYYCCVKFGSVKCLAVVIGECIALYDPNNGKCRQVIQMENLVTCVTFNPTGEFLAAGSDSHEVKVFHLMDTSNGPQYLLYQVLPRRFPLTLRGARIDGARNLSLENKDLLVQCGAEGQPAKFSVPFDFHVSPLDPTVLEHLALVFKIRNEVYVDSIVIQTLADAAKVNINQVGAQLSTLPNGDTRVHLHLTSKEKQTFISVYEKFVGFIKHVGTSKGFVVFDLSTDILCNSVALHLATYRAHKTKL